MKARKSGRQENHQLKKAPKKGKDMIMMMVQKSGEAPGIYRTKWKQGYLPCQLVLAGYLSLTVSS